MRDKKYKRFLEKAFFYYPFTPAGTVLFLICLWIMTNGIVTQNPYNIFLSIMGLIIVILLATIGRVRASRLTSQHFKWDSGTLLYAETDGQFHRVIFENIKVPLFYRLHFAIRGRLRIGNGASCYIFKEGSSSGAEELEIPLNFAFSGIALVKGISSLKDIFGLTRARFGPPLPRTLIVQPAPLRAHEKSFFKAFDGREEKITRKSIEEERYYMREYIPGDRFRDINWKSSSRLSQLVTRISPHLQEKTKLINVEFRHFWFRARESRDSIAHLNLIKSALLFFLKKSKRENPGFTFMVNTAKGGYFLETEEDIENFCLELSTMFFEWEVADSTQYHTNAPAAVGLPRTWSNLSASPGFGRAMPGAQAGTGSELYIFSTPYDLNLPDRLNALRNSEVHLFITRQEDTKFPFSYKNKSHDRIKSKKIPKTSGDITGRGKKKLASDITGRGNKARDKASLVNKTKRIKNYIALKSFSTHPIPGFWVLRKDKVVKKLPVSKTSGIKTIELPLRVRLLE